MTTTVSAPTSALALDSSDLLQDRYGRVATKINELYFLPADSEEHTRLNIQHRMLKIKLDGLYWPKEEVQRVLSAPPEGSRRPRIIDIGTGSGAWAVEMAHEFPHADVIGFDLVPALLASQAPSNCRFECGDINNGLPQYHNTADVIHARMISAGIDDFQTLIDEPYALLRPGGILLYLDGDSVTDENKVPREREPSSPSFSWLKKLLSHATDPGRNHPTVTASGKPIKLPGPRAWIEAQTWMKGMPMWKPQGHTKLLVELGPWKTDMTERDREAAALMQQNFSKLTLSIRPAILVQGYSETDVDSWIEKAQNEIRTMEPKSYVGYSASWAQKAS